MMSILIPCPEVPRCPEVPTAAESACESIASGGSDSESDIQFESECVDTTMAMTSKLNLAAGNYIVKSSCIQSIAASGNWYRS